VVVAPISHNSILASKVWSLRETQAGSPKPLDSALTAAFGRSQLSEAGQRHRRKMAGNLHNRRSSVADVRAIRRFLICQWPARQALLHSRDAERGNAALDGPSSSCRASCRRPEITVTDAFCARVSDGAMRRPDCDLPQVKVP